MTTYLCTETVTSGTTKIVSEDLTYTYCSPKCRSFGGMLPSHNDRDDDHYEFDEECNNCHQIIPFSFDWANEPNMGIVYI